MKVTDFYQLLNPLGFLILAATFFFIGRTRTEVRSAHWFAVAYCFAACGFVIIFLQNILEPWFVTVSGRFLNFMATLLVAGGLIKRANKKIPVVFFGVSTMLTVASVIMFGLITPDQRVIQILSGLITAAVILTGCIMAWEKADRPADKAVVIFFGLFGLSFLVRVGLFMAVGDYATVLASPKLMAIVSAHTLLTGTVALLSAFVAVFAYASHVLFLIRADANRDPLTGLLNRRAFQKETRLLLKKAASAQDKIFILLADIDNFKLVNDTHGHAAGDDLLCKVAKVLEGKQLKNSVTARIGGEEFVIAMTAGSISLAQKFANDLRTEIGDILFDTNAGPKSITISFGIAQHSTHATLLQTQDRADKALYHAKGSGRNCVMTQEDVAISELCEHVVQDTGKIRARS